MTGARMPPRLRDITRWGFERYPTSFPVGFFASVRSAGEGEASRARSYRVMRRGLLREQNFAFPLFCEIFALCARINERSVIFCGSLRRRYVGISPCLRSQKPLMSQLASTIVRPSVGGRSVGTNIRKGLPIRCAAEACRVKHDALKQFASSLCRNFDLR
jgi:hypothetical protein